MTQKLISPQKKVLVYTRNFTNRLIHWLTFFSVITLLITGYYIGEPTAVYGKGEPYKTFVMADIRLIHFYAAMVLDITLLVWLYLAFMSLHNKYWKLLFPSINTVKGAWEIFKCYFTFKKPRFYEHFDPLDGLIFLVLIVLMALQLLTGFQLFVVALPDNYWFAKLIHLSTDWISSLLGGSQNVRLVHRIVEWILIAGVIVHVYLQIAKTVIWQDGHIGQMVGGYKYRDVK